MPLDAKFIPAIWACAREHGIDRDGVHEAIQAGFGKKSVKDLTAPEALQLLDGMRGRRREHQGHGPYDRRLAMRNHGRRKVATGGTDYLVNETELDILRGFATARGMTEASLREFCLKLVKVETPRTMREYNKVLWAFKNMARREGGRHAA